MIACDACLRRTGLIAAIAGRLQIEFKQRGAPARVLALQRRGAARGRRVGRTSRRRYADFDAPAARARADARPGSSTVCRCQDAYPERLRDLADPPAVLHILGDPGALADAEGVGRRGRPPGVGVRPRRRPRAGARALGRRGDGGLRARDGDRLGGARGRARRAGPHDRRARRPARTSRTRPAGPRCTRRSPRAARSSRRCRRARSAHRWCFVARNRIIAALARRDRRRPGHRDARARSPPRTSRTSSAAPSAPSRARSPPASPAARHALIQTGAPLIRDTDGRARAARGRDGPRVRRRRPRARRVRRSNERLELLLAAVEDGHGTLSELAEDADEARSALTGLAELERLGLVRRGFAGRWERAA